MKKYLGLAALTLALIPSITLGHPGHGFDGFASGLAHPVSGLDHLLAMLAVGLWAVILGGRARYVLPVAFVLSMLIGGALAAIGVHHPLAEAGVAASVFVLGLMIAIARRVSLPVAVVWVAPFALFHGYAHVSEMNGSAGAYMTGFVLTTASLHAVGIALGLILTATATQTRLRICGAAIALMGILISVGVL